MAILTAFFQALLIVIVIWVTPSTANDRDEVLGDLREALNKTNKTFFSTKIWISVGNAQIILNDYQGALRTAQKLVKSQPNKRDYYIFLARLIMHGNKIGNPEKAVTLLNYFGNDNEKKVQVFQLIAEMEGKNNKAMAMNYIRKIKRLLLSEKFDKVSRVLLLIRAFSLQLTMDKLEEFPLIKKQLETLISEMKGTDNEKATVHAQMALLFGQNSDELAANDEIKKAIKLSQGKELASLVARCQVVKAQANLGDYKGALKTALSIPNNEPFRLYLRGLALKELALIHISKGNLVTAEGICLLMINENDDKDILFIQIAKKYAIQKKYNKSKATLNKITDKIRKAQGILEVATIYAKNGDKKIGQQLAITLNFPRSSGFNGINVVQCFEFEKPETWRVSFELNKAFGIPSQLKIENKINDLIASAVRCRIIIDGKGKISYFEGMEGWDIRKAASAQSGEDDVRGALTWIKKMPNEKRLLGLIGLTEGMKKE